MRKSSSTLNCSSVVETVFVVVLELLVTPANSVGDSVMPCDALAYLTEDTIGGGRAMRRFTVKDFERMFPNEDSCLEWLEDYTVIMAL